MRIDLHCHTTASDGQLTVAELLLRAVNRQIDVLAITDHDTVAAIAPARQLIKQQKLSLQLIAGVEISACWQNREIHVLGLNIDLTCALQRQLESQQQARRQRAEAIVMRLQKRGVSSEVAQLLRQHAQPGRLHFARWLYQHGYVSSIQKAFDKYLGKGNSAYVRPAWVTLEDAISWIKAAGGLAVLAHPDGYQLSNKYLRRLLTDFVAMGGQGMEVALCRQSPDRRRYLAELAHQYGLLASQGSDFHYPSPWLDLGRNLSLPPELTPVWQKWQLSSINKQAEGAS